MHCVEPLKDIRSIQAMKEYLRKQSQRDLLFFVFGINTGIKISQLLSLKVKDVWDGEKSKEFLYLTDEESGEQQAIYLNDNVQTEIKNYLGSADLKPEDFLFRSKKNHLPITRQQAYRVINSAAKAVGVEGNIGTNTMRKTFGYHAYRKGIAISILMKRFNHHSSSETLRYIGIDKNEKHEVRVDVNL